MECTDVGCPQAGRCPHKWITTGDLHVCEFCELSVSTASWRGLLHRWGVPLEAIQRTAERLAGLGYHDGLLELAAEDVIAQGYDPRQRSRSAPGWKIEHAARRISAQGDISLILPAYPSCSHTAGLPLVGLQPAGRPTCSTYSTGVLRGLPRRLPSDNQK